MTQGNRGKLLVVDTDSAFRSEVHNAANSAVPGCRVYSAADGAVALEMIEELRPNVVLLDLSLPEVNGLELIATLRGDENHKHTKIVVVAEKGGAKEAAILQGMGVSHFLTKPIDKASIMEVLRPLLEYTHDR